MGKNNDRTFGSKEWELAAIARLGDACLLRSCLQSGADPLAQAPGVDCRSALMEAAIHGRLDCVKALIPFGGLDLVDRSGCAPLTLAAMADDSLERLACMKALIEAGCQIPASALSWVLELGGVQGEQACQALLEALGPKRARVAATRELAAAGRKNLGWAPLWLSSWADPLAPGAIFTPLEEAARVDGADFCRGMFEAFEGLDMGSALHFAVEQNRGLALRELLPRAAASDIERRDEKGETPLMRAVLRAQAPAVEALLAAGADLEAKFKNGAMAWEVARRLSGSDDRSKHCWDLVEAAWIRLQERKALEACAKPARSRPKGGL
jgi:hypothetical protein